MENKNTKQEIKKKYFYLNFSDLYKFIRRALLRRKSIKDYFKFQKYQGDLLLKYLQFYDINTKEFTVLDLANGFGGETESLRENCKSIVGLDLNIPPIKSSSHQIIANALLTPFAHSTFDLIICASLIEHVPNPELLIRELERISKPDGYVYLSFPPFYSFWGGHSYSPFHYLGEKRAVALTKLIHCLFRRKLFGSEISTGNSYESAFINWGLYPLTIKKAKKIINESDFSIIDQSTKWLPINFSLLSFINEIFTWHVQFILTKKRSNRMKVCVVTTSMPRYENDHKSPFILDLARSIQLKGTAVSIVGMHIPKTMSKDYLYNIPVRRLHYFIEKYESLQSTRAGIPAEWSKNKCALFLVFLYLMRLIIFLSFNGKKFDIIHANWTIASLAAILTKPFHRKPVVTTLHGSDIFSANKHTLFKYPTFLALNGSDALICVSNALKNEISNLNIPSNKIFVIPNGVDLNKFNDQTNLQRKKIILYVGSLTKKKGVHLLLEAFSIVNRIQPDFELKIIGDGPEEMYLHNISSKLSIKDKVNFYESMPHNEIGKIMQESFMFVLPSIDEGFGVVLVEALASGLPCIAFNSGGVTDILDENQGILVEPGNVSELSSAINELITNRNLYNRLSVSGREIAKEFDWNLIAERVIQIYSRVI